MHLADSSRQDNRQRFGRLSALGVLLWRAGRWQTIGLGALWLVNGLVPTVVILATGFLIEAVPAAVNGGFSSPGGRQVLWALTVVALALLMSGVSQALESYAAKALGTRYAITAHDVVAAATTRRNDIAHLEDPQVAAELAAIEEYHQAGLFRGALPRLGHYVTRRLQGLAAFAILFGFSWWAPWIVLAGWRWVNRSMARWVERGVILGHAQSGSGLRRAKYYRSLAVDSSAAKEARIFGFGTWSIERYAELWRTAMGEVWRERRSTVKEVVISAVGLAMSLAVVVGFISRAAYRGDISVGALVVFSQAVLAMNLLGPLGDIQWDSGRILNGARKVLDLEAKLGSGPQARRGSEEGQSKSGQPITVRLEQINFTYPRRDLPTLKNLDLEIPAGQSLAIVGENGAGKTTLVKLLCGLYEPSRGRIILDPAHDEPLQARNRIGVIFQEFVRYHLSLRANVGFGALASAGDTRQLEAALQDAGGSELLSTLPAGWDSVLSREYERGADLSGGQWQKVALARALMAVRGGAGLLILDEPTASLDVRAEKELFDRFLTITENVTTILVSHRLSSVRRAERIVVLAEGRIVEDGSHDELMRRGDRYATMYALQAERFRSEVPDEINGREVEVNTVA